MLKRIVVLVSLFLLSTAVGHAETVYVWRDANGIRHYSDICPPGEDCKVRRIFVHGYGTKQSRYQTSTSTTTVIDSSSTDTSQTLTGGDTVVLSGGSSTSGTTTTSGGSTISSGTSVATGGTAVSSGGGGSDGGTTTSGETSTASSGSTTTAVSTTTSDSPAVASNDSVTLYWDAVTRVNVSGYRLYFGTASRTYFQSPGQGLNVGNVTSYTVQGLTNGTRYYFATTAYDGGNESTYSNEVFTDIP